MTASNFSFEDPSNDTTFYYDFVTLSIPSTIEPSEETTCREAIEKYKEVHPKIHKILEELGEIIKQGR